MKNTKLVKLLKSFSKNEIIKFKEFVNSPFFNKNQKIIKLYNEIIIFYPEFDSEKFNEVNMFSKIYDKGNYDYFKIRNVISDLYQLSLEYLKYISGIRYSNWNDLNLLSELHDRNLESLFTQSHKQISKKILDLKIKDEFDYYLIHRLAAVNTSHFKFQKTGYSFNLIQNEFDSYLDHSLTGLLKFYSKMLTNKNHGNIDFDLKMFEFVWSYVKDNNFEHNPACFIYKQIISLELSKDENDYKLLSDLKEKYSSTLSEETIYFILLVMNSFAAYKLKSGDESYYPERFSISKEMVSRGFYKKNYILFMNFISVYTSACIAGEIEWAENFTLNFQNGISPNHEKENTLNYCKGYLYFKNKNYVEALEYFSKTNFKLFIAKVMVRSYSIRAFYESDMHEQTFSAIDGFRHYLKNETQIDEDQKNSYFEFLKHLTELTNLKSENIKNKKDKRLLILKNEIRQMKVNSLGIKNWLIDKSENFFKK